MSSEAKTLLITGGASGIGAETARRAAAHGYKIAINYRSRDAQAKAVVFFIVLVIFSVTQVYINKRREVEA